MARKKKEEVEDKASKLVAKPEDFADYGDYLKSKREVNNHG